MEDEIFDNEKPTLWDNWYDVIEKVFLILAIVVSILIMRSLFTQVRKRHEEITQQIKELEAATYGFTELPAPGQTSASLAAASAGEGEEAGEEGEEEDNEMIQADEFFKVKPQADRAITSLHEFIKNHPEETAKLLKVWLMEDEEKGAY